MWPVKFLRYTERRRLQFVRHRIRCGIEKSTPFRALLYDGAEPNKAPTEIVVALIRSN